MMRCTTYLSTGGSDGSTDLELSRRFPEFLGVFAPSSTPFWPPTSGDDATPPIASVSDRLATAGSAEDNGSADPWTVLLESAASSDSGGFLVIPVRCDVAAGQHGCQVFEKGKAVVERSHFIAQRASSAVWGKGQHRAAGVQRRGGKSMRYFVCVAGLVGYQDCLHRHASGCHGLSSCLANWCLPLCG